MFHYGKNPHDYLVNVLSEFQQQEMMKMNAGRT